ncbi:hypothetical protein JW826_06280 [Candidatus Woesearchaeota archaeon]|nr:hypothetical protein [Candidatus Woesearchaeota archaeon]
MRKKKILFLISDTGGGHRASANAVISALERMAPGRYDLKMVDFFNVGNSAVDGVIKGFYSRVIQRHRWVWGLTFSLTNNRVFWRAVQPLYRIIHDNIRMMIDKEKPDLVVSIHPMVNTITKKVLDELGQGIPFLIITTDPVTLHVGWLERGADFTIVATEDAKKCLISLGVQEARVKVLGLPIAPDFYIPVRDKGVVKARFGLRKDVFTVLFSGGGDGGGKIYPVVKRLIKDAAGERLDLQVIVVCGRNEKLRSKLASLGVIAIPFTDMMPELMGVVDLMVIKAGPGTIEESMARGLPIIITSYLPGQEKANIDYARKKWRAFYEPTVKGATDRIKSEFRSPAKRHAPVKAGDAPVYRIAKFISSMLK